MLLQMLTPTNDPFVIKETLQLVGRITQSNVGIQADLQRYNAVAVYSQLLFAQAARHHHTVTPLHRRTVTPSHRRTVTPSRRCTVALSHRLTATPPHRHAARTCCTTRPSPSWPRSPLSISSRRSRRASRPSTSTRATRRSVSRSWPPWRARWPPPHCAPRRTPSYCRGRPRLPFGVILSWASGRRTRRAEIA